MEIDAAIRTRESLSGRGAWHSNHPFFAFQKVWNARFGGLPVYVICFSENTIGQATDKSTVTMFVVEGLSRRHFRDAAQPQTRKNLLLEPSPLEAIFSKRLGKFLVSNAELAGSEWISKLTMLVNGKVAEIFKWAGPSRWDHLVDLMMMLF
jgi:hypothetical protein